MPSQQTENKEKRDDYRKNSKMIQERKNGENNGENINCSTKK